MFDNKVDGRESSRLPAPARRRYLVAGVVASVALHVLVVSALLFWVTRDGTPTATRRRTGTSPLATEITLFDAADPTVSAAAPAPQPQPIAPAAAPMPLAADAATTPAIAAKPVSGAAAASGPALAAATSTGAPVAAPTAGPALDLSALGTDYRRRLIEHIAAHRRPPPPGSRLGLVYVNFSVVRSGDVQSITVAVSSGDAALDRAAVDSVQSATPMPIIPAGFPDQLSVMVPVDFRRQETARGGRP